MTLILCHGLHLGATDWEEHMWGKPPSVLGRLTKTVELFLKLSPNAILFGSGASENEKGLECNVAMETVLDRWDELPFVGITDSKRKAFLDKCIVDNAAMNTREECMNAVEQAKLFGLSEIISVTSPFHAPRVMKELILAAKESEICVSVCPSGEVKDLLKKVTIFEPPHRPDDLSTPIYDIIGNYFSLSEERKKELREYLIEIISK